ncbi:Vacuolar sorting-associated vts1 protein [Rutstroemia sp. NJR-2017a WRK4]|nr:Vacuolar sorting-associated vts1 protein [Rutstroemia sp. NJR-2017a WRK4]
MAAQVPPKLKAADLTRFIVRAAQLETVKPVISYWCEYWIVNQILAKGLHNGDPETLSYTTTLMDKLETIKAENADNDAILDDTAGQAYVEQFGLETFLRADRAVQASKVTKQTADTFQAAATFLELLNIWSPPDAETQAKIKYAKWNAVRIVRALKEGKDPNESNPKPQPAPEEELPPLDPNDPEVQGLDQPPKARQASVEDVPDEQDGVEARLARQSSLDRSLHPSAQVSARGSPGTTSPAQADPFSRDGFPHTGVPDDNVSPLESSPKDRNGSIGGGYFPEVPTFTSEPRDSTVQTAPAPEDHTFDLGLPDTSKLSAPGVSPGMIPSPDFQSFPPPILPGEQPSVPGPQDFYRQDSPPPQPPIYPPPNQQPSFQPPPPQPQHNPYATARVPPSAPPPAQPIPQQLNIDDESIAKAQKHARFAISALNFEDAETAVKELRLALQTLGAQ